MRAVGLIGYDPVLTYDYESYVNTLRVVIMARSPGWEGHDG